MEPRTRRTELIRRAAKGDREAVDALLPEIYDELRGIAGGIFKEQGSPTLAPTAVVHEAYLRLVGAQGLDWQSRTHFLALAARSMRRVLADHHRRRKAAKRGGGWQRVTLSVADGGAPARDLDALAVDEALAELEEHDPRQARIVEHRFFGGLSNEEVAEAVGVSVPTVGREWRHARAWLLARLGEEP